MNWGDGREGTTEIDACVDALLRGAQGEHCQVFFPSFSPLETQTLQFIAMSGWELPKSSGFV